MGAALLALILAAWIVGVVKLFQKRRRILGWIALTGVVIPFVAPVGFVGWFIAADPEVGLKPPSQPSPPTGT